MGDSLPINRVSVVDEGSGVVAVAASSTAIVAANPDRKYLIIQNLHASQTLTLGFGETAAAAQGIRLVAGEKWEMPPNTVFTGAINGIGSGAGTTTGYIEW